MKSRSVIASRVLLVLAILSLFTSLGFLFLDAGEINILLAIMNQAIVLVSIVASRE
jgi:hypothetical protein